MWKTARLRCSVAACVVLACVLAAGPAGAQDPTSAPLAAQLAELMADAELDALAGKDSTGEDRFVAALAFPGQLLVVSARYEVPLYVEAKIAKGEYREVYIDLNAASIGGTKVLVTDAGANGLRATADTVDMFDGGSGTVRFDGNWVAQGLQEAEYMRTFSEADRQYTRMLNALIAQAR
jgi:hypothetical protein